MIPEFFSNLIIIYTNQLKYGNQFMTYSWEEGNLHLPFLHKKGKTFHVSSELMNLAYEMVCDL